MGNEVGRRCVILGSVPIRDGALFLEYGLPSAYVICADGGLDSAVKHGVRPDLVIGDFDSVRSALPKNAEIITLQCEKDDTDMMAAVKVAIERGFRDFTILGALGGERFDHAFANLCVLHYLASHGCRGVIADEHTKVFFLPGGKLNLRDLKGRYLSVFPFGAPTCTVSYQGLKYPLHEEILSADDPRGVSNEIVGDFAQVAVVGGSALVMVLDRPASAP